VDPTDGTPTGPGLVWVLHCPCGQLLQADTEDGIVDASLAHLAERHPDMADAYEREDILAMAVQVRR
jgi:hypothetical protein